MKYILAISLLFICSNLIYSQSNKSLLIGKWNFEKLEFINVDQPTSKEVQPEAKDENKGLVLFIYKNGKYKDVMMHKGHENTVESGNYEMSKDGKYFKANGHFAEIILLDRNYLKLKVDEDGNKVLVFKRALK